MAVFGRHEPILHGVGSKEEGNGSDYDEKQAGPEEGVLVSNTALQKQRDWQQLA